MNDEANDHPPMRYLGVDLAWGQGSEAKPANKSGVVAMDDRGQIFEADWTVGLDETIEWIEWCASDDTILFVDAPLLVLNASGMRRCEADVAQRYGRWRFAANASSKASERNAGVVLLQRLLELGWHYDDGTAGAPTTGRHVSECYPYTALVGAHEFGYVHDTEDREGERPRYKRPPQGMRAATWRPHRAANCDALIQRFATFRDLTPPIDLFSHLETELLVDEPSPHSDKAYKQREDLLDAAICAWTAALWHTKPERMQALGAEDDLVDPQLGRGTIIAPRVLEPAEMEGVAWERVPAWVGEWPDEAAHESAPAETAEPDPAWVTAGFDDDLIAEVDALLEDDERAPSLLDDDAVADPEPSIDDAPADAPDPDAPGPDAPPEP